MHPGTYTKAQLAELLQRSERQFDTVRGELEAHGFPPRLPGFGALWSRAAVDAWLGHSGQSPASQLPTIPIEPEAADPLARRYGDAA